MQNTAKTNTTWNWAQTLRRREQIHGSLLKSGAASVRGEKNRGPAIITNDKAFEKGLGFTGDTAGRL